MSKENSKLNVCLINPQGHVRWNDPQIAEHPDTGGQIVYILELAKELEKCGCRVDLFTRYFKDEQWPGYDSEIEEYNRNLRIIRIKCGPEDKFVKKENLWPFIKDFSMGIKKFYRDRNYEPDIFSSHYADAGLSAAILKKEMKKPFTHTGHSLGGKKMDNLKLSRSNYEMINRNFNFHLRISAERVAFRNARIIFTSTQEEIDRQYGHRVYDEAVDNKDKFRIIPPGINPGQFFSYHEAEKDKDKYDKTVAKVKEKLKNAISPERLELPAIFSPSRFDAKKNSVGLLRAYASSRQLQENCNLMIIAGNIDDPLNPENRDKFKEHKQFIIEDIADIIQAWKLEGKVCLSPGFDYAEEMPYLYRYAGRNKWIFVNPALHEPFGLTIVEAMASGLPAVATKFGGPSEIFKEGKYGILADPNDPHSLSGALEKLLMAGTWKKYSSRGMERVKDKFTWKTAAGEYVKIFKEIKSEKLTDKKDYPVPEYFMNGKKSSDSQLRKELRDLLFLN